MQITFVILHYLTEQDTVECVESILNNIEYDNYSIIIVDNGSSNGSGKKIKDRYQNIKKVDVILSEVNLGFAKGNNLGFIKAKHVYRSDFIVVMNNDMIINQHDFVDKVISNYNETKFAVLGPDIISVIDRCHQNPQTTRIINRKDAMFQLARHSMLLVINYLKLEPLVKTILKSIKHKNVVNYKEKFKMKNVQLHGSCLIFSPKYIQRFDGLYDKTFMYFEEDILFYICRKNKLLTVYSPELQIFHKEDSATNEFLKNNLSKNRFVYKHSIKSIIELLKLMN